MPEISLKAKGGGGGIPPFFNEGVENDSYLAGKYYLPSVAISGLVALSSYTTGSIVFVPFVPKKTHTFDRIAFRTNTASGTVRLGIAESDATDKNPGDLLIDGGTVTLSAPGVYEVTISQALTVGVKYWLAVSVSATLAISSTAASTSFFVGAPASGSQDGFEDYQMTGDLFSALNQSGFTFGAFPSTFAADSTAVTVPHIYLRG